jgi:hypothetical protein
MARCCFLVEQFCTFFLDKRALLVSGAATFTVRQFNTFRSKVIFQSKIITANTAVHTTWSYEFNIHITTTKKRL